MQYEIKVSISCCLDRIGPEASRAPMKVGFTVPGLRVEVVLGVLDELVERVLVLLHSTKSNKSTYMRHIWVSVLLPSQVMMAIP